MDDVAEFASPGVRPPWSWRGPFTSLSSHPLVGLLLRERQRWLLWLPVAFGTGIAIYFALPEEPGVFPLSVLLVAGIVASVGVVRRGPNSATWLLTLAVLCASGYLVAQWRAYRVEAPTIGRPGTFVVEGRVVLVEPRQRGPRVSLEDLHMDRLEPDETPVRVRVTLRGNEPAIRAGDRIEVRARLQPPSAPLLPGGFDFGRQAFFTRLGGLGYALGPASVTERATGSEGGVARLRANIANAAQSAVPGAAGAVSAALLTALRADIPEDVWRHMQLAGLAHLLAISGLHMGLVAGTVFLVARYGLALIPALALRWPVKKPAALIALAAAAFYLLLAGATVPTQRAFLMVGTALVAIMLDRNPFSMRMVALAALVVLLLQPESLLGASFQMSFAAVIALVSFYEKDGIGPAHKPPDGDSAQSTWRPLWLYLAGVMLTTLVASLATAPFAAFHFQRISLFGIVANLVGVPLTAFWIMPTGLLALAAMPFGLDRPFFELMGVGVDSLLGAASLVASLPGAGLMVTQMPTTVLLLVASGGLWICLWQQPWRWLGIFLWIAASVVALRHEPPDLLVDRGGNMAAVARPEGRVLVLRWEKNGFLERSWLRALGVEDALDLEDLDLDSMRDIGCDDEGCRVRIDGLTITPRTHARCRHRGLPRGRSGGRPAQHRRLRWRSAAAGLTFAVVVARRRNHHHRWGSPYRHRSCAAGRQAMDQRHQMNSPKNRKYIDLFSL